MKYVLDTNILVAGIRSPSGASAAFLKEVIQGRLKILVSVPLAFEYEAVCLRAEHILAAGTDKRTVQNIIDVVIGMAQPVAIDFYWRPQLRDACDEMVLEAAVNGGAEAIVTYNQKHCAHAAKRFGIEIKTPKQILDKRQKR